MTFISRSQLPLSLNLRKLLLHGTISVIVLLVIPTILGILTLARLHPVVTGKKLLLLTGIVIVVVVLLAGRIKRALPRLRLAPPVKTRLMSVVALY